MTRNNTLLGALYALYLWITMVSMTFVVLLLMLPFIVFRLPTVIHWLVAHWASSLILIGGFKVQIENKELLYQDGPVIFLVNHQSYMDIISLYQALDLKLVWMAKASLFKIPLFGWAMKASGCIPVERSKASQARKSIYQAASRIQNGYPLLVFPEGTRGHANGQMLPFKSGAFVLAKMAKVAVQPITLYGQNEVLPAEQSNWIPRFFNQRTMTVCLHKIIHAQEFQEWSVKEFSAKVRQAIDRPIDRLRDFNDILDT